ncbi:MAG: D-alanyl-D-alanine carboxypeptidase [Muribaculaceae bacterium]|nr:D-alanyl-D-alanine carboxypeptidase [Muribaculaceae bacterium]
MNKLRYFLTLSLSLLLFLTVRADYGNEAIAEFLRTNGVPANSVAVKIIDLSNGKVIGSHNEESPLIPASIMKSVTTAALLGKSGPDWKYQTRVYIDGPNDLGYLRGNIIVTGACDPTVNSGKLPYSPDLVVEICKALESLLIDRVEGSIIIDDSEFAGPPRPASWTAADTKRDYGTGSHAFNYSDNTSGSSSVMNPSSVFLKELKKEMEARGIELENKELISGRKIQILNHNSAPIDEIMRSCMMRSDNMFAEAMLRTYGKFEGGDGSTEDAAKREYQLWKSKKMPLEGVVIIDGSGLSRQNKVTANFMAEMLKSMSKNPYYASFFPLAGQEGTLKKFLKDTELDSYIAMKTGSMTGIQCYAGYKFDDNYSPTHVIVIIMNDIPGDRQKAVNAAQKMLLTVFGNQ